MLQTRGGMDQGEDLIIVNAEKSTEKGSDSIDEMANVLSTLGAANVLSSRGKDSTAVGIFTTASVTTPYTRKTRASRGIIIESKQTTSVPIINAKGKGKEEQFIREQGEKDTEIARAQAERELRIMIVELDRSNEVIAKYMNEYKQVEADLSLEEKMELITELINSKGILLKSKYIKPS
ncbi:hypothetical protein Tco_1231553 [Tanacetum coccineum]